MNDNLGVNVIQIDFDDFSSDPKPVPPNTVLLESLDELESVCVIGRMKHTGSLYISSSDCDIDKVLGLVVKGKSFIERLD